VYDLDEGADLVEAIFNFNLEKILDKNDIYPYET
jgi:hypothetical protein